MAVIRDYLPTRDAELVAFANNLSARVTSTPTAFGLTAAIATGLAAANTAWLAAYTAAIKPSTRTPTTVVAKDAAKAALVAQIRMVSRIVQATPSVTDQQKTDLGLTVRKSDAPIPPPSMPPAMKVMAIVGRTIKLQLADAASSTRRGKPKNVQGASVFSYVGATPPNDMGAWKFEGSTTRANFDLAFGSGVADGATVWVTAFWFNPRSQSGPACQPIKLNVQAGLAMAA